MQESAGVLHNSVGRCQVYGTQRCEKVQHVEHKVAHKSSAGGAWGCRKARRVVHNGVRRRWGDVIVDGQVLRLLLEVG